jgi:hypothetical protein
LLFSDTMPSSVRGPKVIIRVKPKSKQDNKVQQQSQHVQHTQAQQVQHAQQVQQAQQALPKVQQQQSKQPVFALVSDYE